MEPMGHCPVCGRAIAPSCESCPGCGNRDWYRRTGNTGEGFAQFACPTCLGGATQYTCTRCDRQGYIREKRQWAEWADARTGATALAPLEQDLFDPLNSLVRWE